MTDLQKIKEQLKTYGIKNEKELDIALEKNMQQLNIGIMTSDINDKRVG